VSAKPKLLIATTNEGKLREIRSLLEHLPLRLVGLDELGVDQSFKEPGDTFAENSIAKALYYHYYHSLPTIADDSGLVIDALGGEPGVRSSRFLGEESSYAEKMERVLARLREISAVGLSREARFTCALSLAVNGRVAATIVKHTFGTIADAPCGGNGFGYDPIFFSPELGKTFGEATDAEKEGLSHRAQALRSLVSLLETHKPLRSELKIAQAG
jgi:XTP/dITP diphosphohydrolase